MLALQSVLHRCRRTLTLVLLVLGLLQLTGCASTEELYAQYDETACLLPVAETRDRVVVKEVLYRDSLVWEPAVYFDYKKDFLQGRESERLKENLAVLKKYPDLRVVIRGFTDAVGSNRYNQDLAERRVKFVFNYLRGQGIAARRMVNMPLGEEMPFLRSRDEAGDAINRRVELVLTDGSGRPVAYRVESFMDVNNAATEE